MGVFDKLKDLVGIDDEEYEDEDEELEEAKEVKKAPTFERPVSRPIVPSTTPSAESRPVEQPKQEMTRTMGAAKYTSQWKMEVTEPAGFDECPRLVDSLKAKKPVIINLENLDTDVARKIFDFLSGATYALNGNVQKVANYIFVFAPENVTISYKDNQKSQTAEKPVKSPWV